MSRIPAGPQPVHFSQQLPPPQGYYMPNPNPSLPPNYQQLPPVSAPSYPNNLSQQGPVYSLERGPPTPLNGGGGWISQEGYPHPNTPATAGPSRGPDNYLGYPQPPRSSPSQLNQARQSHTSNGWSSVHPHPALPPGRGVVKLEDLVSGERPPPPASNKQLPAVTPLSSIPLSASASFDTAKRPSSAGGENAPAGSGNTSGSGGPGGGGGNSQPGPSDFIKKLYKMLEEESQTYGGKGKAGKAKGDAAKRGSVGWGKGGTTFVVWDMNDFTTKILPQTFRHSNFSSFVRQLNKYGFSKIKHVDEESGTIKENIWEFQHPSFQAGGKADLENIKRKTVATKKGGAGDFEDASPRGAGMTAEEASRINLMENRVNGLEDKLSRALDELRDARVRESGVMGLLRDVIGHLAASEKEAVGSPASDSNHSPRVFQLLRSFESLAQGAPSTLSSFSTPLPSISHRGSGQFHPLIAANYAAGIGAGAPMSTRTSPRAEGSGGRASFSGPSSAGMRAPTSRVSSGTLPAPPLMTANGLNAALPPPAPPLSTDEIIELSNQNQMQTLFNGEPLGLTPIFSGDAPAWNGDGQVAGNTYQRKSSDGTTLRFIADALGTSNGVIPAPSTGVRFEEPQDPLDPSSRRSSVAMSMQPPVTVATTNGGTNESSFGTLAVPPAPEVEQTVLPINPEQRTVAPISGIKGRRSTIKPNWMQTPKILVVEDDYVYRTLSSKFLEKFGCVTETVENAQGAVDKMNNTKYDLVLMDIFFGPNMDGRKATSLIRQFDNYTPIISMTSNARPQDVDSYFRSGMNDILAKPFTNDALYLILDKHLVHLRHAQLYERLIPMSVGVPPLSDQHVVEALTVNAASLQQQQQQNENGDTGTVVATNGTLALDGFRNPLAGTGWSDDQYSFVLSQFLATGTMPDVNSLSNGTIGTSVVFSDATAFNDRKRSIEAISDDDWMNQAQSQAQLSGVLNIQPQMQDQGQGQGQIQEIALLPSGMIDTRETKRSRGMTGTQIS